MPLLKPGRWSVKPSLLEPLGQELSRGLVDLLPFWDDAPTNVADGSFEENTKYGWAEGSASWQSKAEPTSHGAGWLNNGTANVGINTDRTVTPTEGQTDWTHLFVVRIDSHTGDSGLHGFNGSNQFWFDTTGTSLRVGTQTSGGVVYGSTFHEAGDNGTTYVVLFRNNHQDTRTDVWVDGVNHVSLAGRQNVAGAQTFYVASTSATSKPLNGSLVEFARWNRALTDTEVQTLSFDPFLLLRPALLETEVAVGDQTITIGIAPETDTVPSITPVKPIIQAVGLVTETDTAFTIVPVKPIIQTVGLVTETDTVPSVTPVKPIIQTVGLASETDTALAINLIRTVGVGIVTETDTALGVTVLKPIIQTVGIATEIDTALTITATGPSVFVSVKGFVSMTETVSGVTMADAEVGDTMTDSAQGATMADS